MLDGYTQTKPVVAGTAMFIRKSTGIATENDFIVAHASSQQPGTQPSRVRLHRFKNYDGVKPRYRTIKNQIDDAGQGESTHDAALVAAAVAAAIGFLAKCPVAQRAQSLLDQERDIRRQGLKADNQLYKFGRYATAAQKNREAIRDENAEEAKRIIIRQRQYLTDSLPPASIAQQGAYFSQKTQAGRCAEDALRYATRAVRAGVPNVHYACCKEHENKEKSAAHALVFLGNPNIEKISDAALLLVADDDACLAVDVTFDYSGPARLYPTFLQNLENTRTQNCKFMNITGDKNTLDVRLENKKFVDTVLNESIGFFPIDPNDL